VGAVTAGGAVVSAATMAMPGSSVVSAVRDGGGVVARGRVVGGGGVGASARQQPYEQAGDEGEAAEHARMHMAGHHPTIASIAVLAEDRRSRWTDVLLAGTLCRSLPHRREDADAPAAPRPPDLD
jgi:hypothetical protein